MSNAIPVKEATEATKNISSLLAGGLAGMTAKVCVHFPPQYTCPLLRSVNCINFNIFFVVCRLWLLRWRGSK